ncbi:MAG: NAD(P)-dependent oxidoreductase [Actinomycetota bacterium]|nr:NAD(P)-dependent oxidoreductase [Actinomycetota bacterium]
MSRVLVTGASGFIGSHAIAPLLAAGHEVHAVSSREPAADAGAIWHRANLLESAEVIAAVRPDVLLHLAWYTEHGRFWTAPDNVRWVEASLALLRTFVAVGGRRAVLAGTCAEYDWSGEEPLDESETPLRPATLYGAAKHALHAVALAYAAQVELELAWGRVFFLYGPGEAPGRLVPAVARALLAAEPARTTAGTQVRDLLHVHDVATAFAALVDSDVSGAVNVASGEGVALREVIELVAQAAGRRELLELGALHSRPDEPDRLVADVTRLREEVGFRPHVTLPEGIESTVAWWRSRGLASC